MQHGALASEAEPPRPLPLWATTLVLGVLLLLSLAVGYVLGSWVTAGRAQVAVPTQQPDIDSWSRRVAADPKDEQSLLGLGFAYQTAGQYAHALDVYSALVQLDPASTPAYYNEGVIYAKQGKDALAEHAWWKVLGLDKTHAQAAEALGRVYQRKGQYQSLLTAVEPALAAHPEDAELEYLDGLAQEHLGNRDLATQRYRAALQYSPDLVEARTALQRLGAIQQ